MFPVALAFETQSQYDPDLKGLIRGCQPSEMSDGRGSMDRPNMRQKHSLGSQTRTARGIAWRMLWLAALIAHAPLTAGVMAAIWRDGGDASVGRLLLIVASNLFFLIEISFAPCARAIRDRRTAVALILIVALLHSGVIDRALSFDSPAPNTELCLFATLAGAVAIGRREPWALLAGRVRGRAPRTTHGIANADRRRRPESRAHRAAPQAQWRSAPLRAPPATA